MDADDFYQQLKRIEKAVRGRQPFEELPAAESLPPQGVYFFFEPNEQRLTQPPVQRVVRVGTHAVSQGSRTTLRDRLQKHWGTQIGGGHSGGSQFRYLVGASIIGSYNWLYENRWPSVIEETERKISQYIRRLSFLVFPIIDQADRHSFRAIVEKNSIAILSNINRRDPDTPSKEWLGNKCPKEKVCNSGLWNINYVTRGLDSNFSKLLDQQIKNIE